MPTTGLSARKTAYMCKTILLLVDAADRDVHAAAAAAAKTVSARHRHRCRSSGLGTHAYGKAVDIIRTVCYIHGPLRDRIFAVLCVSNMDLTACYKTSFFTFIMSMIIRKKQAQFFITRNMCIMRYMPWFHVCDVCLCVCHMPVLCTYHHTTNAVCAIKHLTYLLT